MELRTDLDLDPAQVGAVRHTLMRYVIDQGVPADRDLLMLLASELVTNAIRYGEPPLELVVRTDDHHLRLEVHDCNEAPPIIQPPGEVAVGGHGLQLVNALADRWGWAPGISGGKLVWFELDLPTSATAQAR